MTYYSDEEARALGRNPINLEGALNPAEDNSICFSPMIASSLSAALGKIAKHSPVEVYIRNKPSAGRIYFYTRQDDNFSMVYSINTKLLIRKGKMTIKNNKPFCYLTHDGIMFARFIRAKVTWDPESDINMAIVNNSTQIVIWDQDGTQLTFDSSPANNSDFIIPSDPITNSLLSFSWKKFDALRQFSKKKNDTDFGGKLAIDLKLLKFAPGSVALEVDIADNANYMAFNQDLRLNEEKYYNLKHSLYYRELHKTQIEDWSIMALVGNYQISTMSYRMKSKYKKDSNISLNNFVDFTFIKAPEMFGRNKVKSDPKGKCIISNQSMLDGEICDEVFIICDSNVMLIETKTVFDGSFTNENPIEAHRLIKEGNPVSSFQFNSDLNKIHQNNNLLGDISSYNFSNSGRDHLPVQNNLNYSQDNNYVPPNNNRFNLNMNNNAQQSVSNTFSSKYSSKGGERSNLNLNERINAPIREEVRGRDFLEEYMNNGYKEDVVNAYLEKNNNDNYNNQLNFNKKFDSSLNFDNNQDSCQMKKSDQVPFNSNIEAISNAPRSNFSITDSQLNQNKPQVNNFAFTSNIRANDNPVTNNNYVNSNFQKLIQKNCNNVTEKIEFKESKLQIPKNLFGSTNRYINMQSNVVNEQENKIDSNPKLNLKKDETDSKPKKSSEKFLFKK